MAIMLVKKHFLNIGRIISSSEFKSTEGTFTFRGDAALPNIELMLDNGVKAVLTEAHNGLEVKVTYMRPVNTVTYKVTSHEGARVDEINIECGTSKLPVPTLLLSLERIITIYVSPLRKAVVPSDE